MIESKSDLDIKYDLGPSNHPEDKSGFNEAYTYVNEGSVLNQHKYKLAKCFNRKSKSILTVSENRVRFDSGSSSRGLSADNINRLDKPVSDWTIEAQNRVHYWIDSNYSGDNCYLSEQECERTGAKKKCVSCKITVHSLCLNKLSLECRPTFREAGVRDYRNDTRKESVLLHHWVHRKRQDGKCRQCNKSFQNKLRFSVKEVLAVECSWCKTPYHNKPVCFTKALLAEHCSRGQHAESIIPPAWIIKMNSKNTFKSSVRRPRSPDTSSDQPFLDLKNHVKSAVLDKNVGLEPVLSPIPDVALELERDKAVEEKQNLTKKVTAKKVLSFSQDVTDNTSDNSALSSLSSNMHKSISLQSNMWLNSIPFVVKPLPNSPPTKPLLVFINPKSGGNDGSRLLRKFQWLLNPRQVFDISDRGPKLALELFGKIPNLRILVCGGDGTAGWVMSEIDNLKICPSPPIAILPLGTGNDLARTTQWGGGYKDESLSKIITLVEEGVVRSLDRWNVTSELYDPSSQLTTSSELSILESSITISESSSLSSTVKLPLNVFNNYFSLGVDAAAALEFHECREANPEKFNSRIKNKMFYAGIGGREIFKASWKDLWEYVKIICDDIDYTPKIKEMKPHVLLFLNIPRYSAGTTPWGTPSSSYGPQSFSDGKLEVMGLTPTSLATLQVGGHGDRICQCSNVQITTSKTIPMQVDGEPCRLLPSHISISLRNRFQIIMRPKRRTSVTVLSDPDSELINETDQWMKVGVFVIPLIDYENNVLDRQKILDSARFYGMLKEKGGTTLSNVRESLMNIKSDWCIVDEGFTFLDSTTSERMFRIERTKEDAHFLMDICDEDLYVLDPKLGSSLMADINKFSFEGTDQKNDSVENELDLLSNAPDALISDEDNDDNDDKVDDNLEIVKYENSNEKIWDDECYNKVVVVEGDNDDNSCDECGECEKDDGKIDTASVNDVNEDEMNNEKNGEGEYKERGRSVEENKNDENAAVKNGFEENVLINENYNDGLNNTSAVDADRTHSSKCSSMKQNENDICNLNGLGLVQVLSHSTDDDEVSLVKNTRFPLIRKYTNGAELNHLFLEACKHSSIDRVQSFVLDGADISATDDSGCTGLHLATVHKNLAAVHYLIHNGPSTLLEVKEYRKGRTALHLAASLGRHSVCSLLISAGASLLARDNDNQLPSHLASEINDRALTHFLQSKRTTNH